MLNETEVNIIRETMAQKMTNATLLQQTAPHFPAPVRKSKILMALVLQFLDGKNEI